MSKDVLKKDKARNQQPPSSHDGGESAYGNPEVTAANEVGLDKKERLNPIGSGVLSDQPREHGNQYPGRKLPPTVPVTTATVQTGVARKCVETQTHSNMHERNAHEEKKVGK